MLHRPSTSDLEFLDDFEHGRFKFPLGHRAHVRMAYIYLTEFGVKSATARAREAIQNFFCYRDIDPEQYNETLTRSWMLAGRHGIENTPAARSSAEFFEQNKTLLDSSTMLTHYSYRQLYSEKSREEFVAPDLEPIPSYDDD